MSVSLTFLEKTLNGLKKLTFMLGKRCWGNWVCFVLWLSMSQKKLSAALVIRSYSSKAHNLAVLHSTLEPWSHISYMGFYSSQCKESISLILATLFLDQKFHFSPNFSLLLWLGISIFSSALAFLLFTFFYCFFVILNNLYKK